MKIAMLGQKGIPAHEDGATQAVEMLSRQLVSRGHHVVAYCRRSYCGKDAKTRREGNLQLVVRPSIATKHLDAITHTMTSTADIAFRRANVVHYHCVGPALMAPFARMVGLPVVVTVQGLDWQRAKWGKGASRCIRLGEQLAVKCAKEIIVVSPMLRDYFRQQYGIQTHFIPNGVVPIPRVPPNRLAEFGLEPGNYLLAVARLVPEKGLHYLVEAFSKVKTDRRLVIAGGGRFDDSYEKTLRSLADSRVVFTGLAKRDLLAELYSHAHLFVLPSDLEGMSLALLEGMSMGVPPLVSDIPENACVVGDAGFTFKAANVADLREVLQRLLDDDALIERYRERAKNAALPYQWPTIAAATERVYALATGIKLSAVDQESAAANDVTSSAAEACQDGRGQNAVILN